VHVSYPKIPNAYAMQCILKNDNSKSCEQDQKFYVQDWEIELITIGVNFLDEFDTHPRYFDRITLAEVMPYNDYCWKMFNKGITLMKDLEITQNNVWDYNVD
jgi:hypothetical protein